MYKRKYMKRKILGMHVLLKVVLALSVFLSLQQSKAATSRPPPPFGRSEDVFLLSIPPFSGHPKFNSDAVQFFFVGGKAMTDKSPK